MCIHFTDNSTKYSKSFIEHVLTNIDSMNVIELRMIYHQMRLLANSVYGSSTEPTIDVYDDYIKLRNALVAHGRMKEMVE